MSTANNPYDAPMEKAAASPVAFERKTRSVTIRRLDPLSLGKMSGALYALIGLVAGVFFAFLGLLGVAVGGGDGLTGGVIGGLGVIIIFPILYGVMGLIAGLIGGLLYNLVAGLAGGVQMDLEVTDRLSH